VYYAEVAELLCQRQSKGNIALAIVYAGLDIVLVVSAWAARTDGEKLKIVAPFLVTVIGLTYREYVAWTLSKSDAELAARLTKSIPHFIQKTEELEREVDRLKTQADRSVYFASGARTVRTSQLQRSLDRARRELVGAHTELTLMSDAATKLHKSRQRIRVQDYLGTALSKIGGKHGND